MNTTVTEYYRAKKLLPSKMADMLTEIALEGYELKQWELGWNIWMLGTRVLDKSLPTKEACVEAAHAFIFKSA